MRIITGVDPGHGGDNDGAFSQSRATREADLTLAVGKRIRELYSSVYLTRDDDQSIGYKQRAVDAAEADVEFMAALHYDSTPHASYKHGCHLYYGKDDSIALDVAKFAMLNTPIPLRGGRIIEAYVDPNDPDTKWKKDAEYICNVYKCPTLLFELGYLSNEADLKYLITTYGIDDCAQFVLSCLEYARKLLKGSGS
jgi:N-acetylmuramoyl-L-alanine amidase